MVIPQTMDHKIQPRHLKLLAYIYIRQSSDRQTRENTGSTEVQRMMREHAVACGFAPENIRVIERDQGRTGATTEGRDGFKEMLSDVLAGRVGAIFSSHSSRLARDSRASQHLVLCCESAGTLIIDQHGVYDPRNENDLFFLGIKGVIDEVELRRIRTQLLDARMAKVRKGEFRIPLPVGFVWERDGTIQFDPDENVRRAVRNAFELFESLGSASAVARYFRNNGLLFPRVIMKGARKGAIEWSPLRVCRLSSIYRNPIYSGAYVYGRTSKRTDVTLEGELMAEELTVKHRIVRVLPEQWAVFIPDFHKGYVTPEQQRRIQEQLRHNRSNFEQDTAGAPRSGPALFQGLVFCKQCSLRIRIRYSKKKKNYFYCCNGNDDAYGVMNCATFPGRQVDKNLTPMILQAFEPAQLEMSVESANHAEARAQEVYEQLDREIKRAKEDAEYAYYRFLEADPKNVRLAGRLEEDSEKKFAEVERLKRKRAEVARSSPKILTSSQLADVTALAQDIPQVWHSAKMTQQVRKMLVRAIVDKIELERDEATVSIIIYWRTGARTETSFTILRGTDYTRTNFAVVDLVRHLALELGDREIAVRLNEAGHKTGQGMAFNFRNVRALRKSYDITSLLPERPRHSTIAMRGDGRYSVKSLAEMLNVPVPTVLEWREEGRFDAIQYSPKGTWWIKITRREIEELRWEVSQSRVAEEEFPELMEVNG